MPEMVYDPVRKISYDRACKGCIYLSRAGGYGCCNYIFMKGKPRPCPGGRDCTVKEFKKKRLKND